MACVRLNYSIRYDITKKAGELFDKEINSAKGALAEDFGDRIYKLYFGTDIPVMEALQSKHKDLVSIADHGNVCLVHSDVKKKDMAIAIYFSKVRPYPVSYGFRPKIFSDSLYEEYDTYSKKIHAVIEKKDNFVREISSILDKCTTLKQFLDAWPAGKTLVDQELIQKMHEKPPKKEPSKFVPPEASINLNTVVLTKKIIDG
jgi:hypothetical protein